MGGSFKKFHFISAPGSVLDTNKFCTLLEGTGGRLARFAAGLRLDVRGRILYDSDGIRRNVTASLLRKDLESRDGMVFGFRCETTLIIRYERMPEFSRIEINIPVIEFDALSTAIQDKLSNRFHDWAREMRIPYTLRFDTLFRQMRKYWRFEDGNPIIRFEKFDISNASFLVVGVAPEFGGKPVQGEGLQLDHAGVSGTGSHELFHGRSLNSGESHEPPPEEAVLEEHDWWGSESEIEAWLNSVEAQRELMPRWEPEFTMPSLDSRNDFARSVDEVVGPLLPPEMTEARWSTIKRNLGDLYSEQELLEKFPSLTIAKGGAVHAVHSSYEASDETYNGTNFAIWDRVSGNLDEMQRLSKILEIVQGMKAVVEPLSATIDVHYHDREQQGPVKPERKVVARITELPEHVSLVTFGSTIIPFNEDTLSPDSIEKTLAAALRLPPPAGAKCVPFWSEIDFQCVRLSIQATDVFNIYKVYSGSEDGVLGYPLVHTSSGFKLDAPDVTTRFMPPVHMKSERSVDIVGVRFYLYWSPWRTKGTPEYTELRKAVLALRAKGWKVDDSAHNLFDLPSLNQS